MANALVRQEQPMAEQIEQVVIGGDLNALTASQRVTYYHKVCESVGLNPLTRPFDYLRLNGKLVLYARRDAADQLRTIHSISLSKPAIEYVDDLVIVTIEAVNKQGRTDTDLGAVSIKGLQGEAKANAILKCITKAKRRVTLSLAGLGWLDETEVDSIPGAQRVTVDVETGEIVDAPATKLQPEEDFGMGQPAAVDPEKQEALATLDRLGKEFYGEEWAEQCPKLVEAVTTGATKDCQELTLKEAKRLITGIEKKMAAVRGEVVGK